MQKSLGTGAAGLIDHNERSGRELVLIADAGHQTRHLIGAAAGTGRYHELNRLGRLPSDRNGLSNKELNDKSRRDYSTQATYELHRTLPFSGSALHSDKTRPCLICRSEEHTSELQSLAYLVCRLLLEKKN